jgi:hypothetical protein
VTTKPRPIHFVLAALVLLSMCGASMAIGYIADIGHGRISPGEIERIVEELEPMTDTSQVTIQIATGIGIKQSAEPAMTVTSTRTTIERAEPVKNNWLLALATALACLMVLAGVAAANSLPDWPFGGP